MTSIFLRALRVFGPERQLRKAAEEASEFSAAAIRYLDDPDAADHLAEELADIEIMCYQVRQIIGNGPVNEWKEKKAKRLHTRLEVIDHKRRAS